MQQCSLTTGSVDKEVFEHHLRELESNQLAIFQCNYILQRIQQQKTADDCYEYYVSGDYGHRIEHALVERNTKLRELWLVLGWKATKRSDDNNNNMNAALEHDNRSKDISSFVANSYSLREVGLSCPNPQPSRTMARITAAVQYNPNITSLVLASSVSLPLQALLDVLEHSKTLRNLNLKGKVDMDDYQTFSLTPSHLQHFCHALARTTSLKELTLEWINFQHSSSSSSRAKRASSLVKQSRQHEQEITRNTVNSSIRNLTILSCHFDFESTKVFMPTLACVRNIHLEGNKGLVSWIYQLYKPPTPPRLPPQSASINTDSKRYSQHPMNFRIVSHSFPKGEWLKKFLKRNQNNLHSLSLHANVSPIIYINDQECDDDDDEQQWRPQQRQHYEDFVENLRLGVQRHTSLKALDIRPVDVRLADQLLLNGTAPGLVGITSLSLHLAPHQTTIPHSLLQFLQSSSCRLQRLQMTVQNSSFRNGLEPLCSALRYNQSLVAANIHFSIASHDTNNTLATNAEKFHDDFDGIWETHLPFLTLQQFAFTGCQAPADFFEHFWDALPMTQTISDLEIGWISWNAQAIQSLCHYLSSGRNNSLPCTLSSLVLHESGTLEPPQISRLFQALAENQSLLSLTISCTVSGLTTVASYIPKLTTLQHLELQVRRSDSTSSSRPNNKQLQIDILQAARANSSLHQLIISSLGDPYEYWFPSRLVFFGLRNKANPLLQGLVSGDVPAAVLPRLLAHLQQKEWCPAILFHVLTKSVGVWTILGYPGNDPRQHQTTSHAVNNDGAAANRDDNSCTGCFRRLFCRSDGAAGL